MPCPAILICPLCGDPHELSQCPRWRVKGDTMAYVLLGLGTVLAAIGLTETVRGWAAGDSGLMQGLLGVIVSCVGVYMVAAAVGRLLA